MNITPLTPNELAAVSDIETACFSSEAWSESQIKAQLENPRMLNLGVWDDNQLLGFAFVSVVLDEAELFQIGVRPDVRGKRIASQLLQRIIEELKAQQVIKLMLDVRETNQAAIRLYTAHNFSEDGRRKGYYPPSEQRQDGRREDALLYSLRLS